MPDLGSTLAYELLGSFIGQKDPSKYVQEYDPNKYNLKDPNTLPFKSPSLGTRLFHPEVAEFIRQQNLAPYTAVSGAQNQLKGTRTILEPVAGRLGGLSIPEAAAGILGFGSLGGLNEGIKASHMLGTGAPSIVGTGEGKLAINDVKFRQQKQQEEQAAYAAKLEEQRRMAQAGNKVNLPEALVNADLARANLTPAQTADELARIEDTKKLRTDAFTSRQAALRAQQARDERDLLARTQKDRLEKNQAEYNAALSDTKVSNIPLDQGTLANSAFWNRVKSNYAELPSYAAQRSGDSFTVNKTPFLSEQERKLADMMPAKKEVLFDKKTGKSIGPVPTFEKRYDLNGKLIGGSSGGTPSRLGAGTVDRTKVSENLSKVLQTTPTPPVTRINPPPPVTSKIGVLPYTMGGLGMTGVGPAGMGAGASIPPQIYEPIQRGVGRIANSLFSGPSDPFSAAYGAQNPSTVMGGLSKTGDVLYGTPDETSVPAPTTEELISWMIKAEINLNPKLSVEEATRSVEAKLARARNVTPAQTRIQMPNQ